MLAVLLSILFLVEALFPLSYAGSEEGFRRKISDHKIHNYFAEVWKIRKEIAEGGDEEDKYRISKRRSLMKELMKHDPSLFFLLAESGRNKANFERKELIKGLVEIVHHDEINFSKLRDEYFLHTKSKRFKLYPVSDFRPEAGSEISFLGYTVGDNIVFNPAEGISVLSGERNEALGEQRTLVILLNPETESAEPFTEEEAHNIVFGSTVSKFMTEQSYGAVSFTGDVLPWTTFPARGSCTLLTSAELEGVIDSYNIDLSGYDRIINLVHIPTLNFLGGCSTIGKSEYVIGGTSYRLSQASVSTYGFDIPARFLEFFRWTLLDGALAHELGHSLGLHHANGWDCGGSSLGAVCAREEYGNLFDVMGQALYSSHTNAFYKQLLGWLPPSRILSVTESGRFALQPFERSDGVAAARIKLAGSDAYPYYLEFRQNQGFDVGLGRSHLVSNLQGLMVNRILDISRLGWSVPALIDARPTSLTWASDLFEVTLNAGQSLIDERLGIEIETVSSTLEILIFETKISPPPCERTPPTLFILEGSATPVIASGGAGYVTLILKNDDYFGCGPAAITVTPAPGSAGWVWEETRNQTVNLLPEGAQTAYLGFGLDIPPDTPPGSYNLAFEARNEVSGLQSELILPIEIVSPPHISEVLPHIGPAGTGVIIKGSGFDSQSTFVDMWKVNFGYLSDYLEGIDISATEEGIEFTVPEVINVCAEICEIISLPLGRYEIIITANGASAKGDFIVVPPAPVKSKK
ncbi:MAG: hypothetical protein HYT43_00090 [Candidatus Taylorbacteria bacterium]|nr:hypothetical protein [Candidatus Taylorbacteria bacterium]